MLSTEYQPVPMAAERVGRVARRWRRDGSSTRQTPVSDALTSASEVIWSVSVQMNQSALSSSTCSLRAPVMLAASPDLETSTFLNTYVQSSKCL